MSKTAEFAANWPMQTNNPGQVTLTCGSTGQVTLAGKYVCDKCGLFWYDMTNDCYSATIMWQKLVD